MTENENKAVRTMQIPITLNRASLGDADYTFAVVLGTQGAFPTYVLRRDVMIDEQKLINKELSAKLTVEVVEEHEDYFLVETEIGGPDRKKLRVNKEQGKVEPVIQGFYYH